VSTMSIAPGPGRADLIPHAVWGKRGRPLRVPSGQRALLWRKVTAATTDAPSAPAMVSNEAAPKSW